MPSRDLAWGRIVMSGRSVGGYEQASTAVGTDSASEIHLWTNVKSKKLSKRFKKVCHHPDDSKETRKTATCWGLAYAYRAIQSMPL